VYERWLPRASDPEKQARIFDRELLLVPSKFMSRPLAPIRTDRLVLRPWTRADREPFAAMNADPRVMEYFPALLSRAESDATADRIERHFEERGFGLWGVEVPGEASFIGYVGLMVPAFEAPFMPCVEVGWRLAQAHWGLGYATEGARAALRQGCELGLTEVVSMTVLANRRSRRVMEKLGMKRDPADDFDHPRLPPGSPLRRHILYRLSRRG
jgi:RimJ/RimL family protein N-acetyltransferase